MQIMLSVTPGAPVQIRCGTIALFEARVGRRKNSVAVRIEREVARIQPGERS
jgi:flagellar motor switch protein FliM